MRGFLPAPVLMGAFLASACLLGAPRVASAQTSIPMQSAPPAAPANEAPRQPVPWSSLSPAQQRMLAPLQSQWDQLKPGRQHHLAQNAEHWTTLPPERQQQIRDRLTRWAAMTPEERRQLRENARAFHNLTPEERAKVNEAFRKFQSLSPAERRALRERWRAMPPQQRQQWLQKGTPEPHRPRGH